MKTHFIILILLTLLSAIFADASFQKFADACKNGDAIACLKAGDLYSSDPENAKLDASDAASIAASYYKRSCDLGYAKGCTAYGMHFYADTERDSNKSDIFCFKKGCEGGDKIGCTLLKMAPTETN